MTEVTLPSGLILHTFGPHEVGRKYHVEAPTPKHVENSPQGCHYAKHHGFRTIDLDMLPDADLVTLVRRSAPLSPAQIAGHLHNTHWDDPFRHDGFRDPKGILHRGDVMHDMHQHEVDRLVAGHRWTTLYHIPRMEAQLSLCHQLGIQALMEPKHSAVWMREEVWAYLANYCAALGVRAAVYSLQHECLPIARHAGFHAWPI